MYLLKSRDEWFEKFVHLYKFLSSQQDLPIQTFRADGEFVTSELRKFGEQHGITFEFTCGHSSFQNGPAERIIRTISEMGLSMLFHSGLGVIWWPEFILTASYILNRCEC